MSRGKVTREDWPDLVNHCFQVSRGEGMIDDADFAQCEKIVSDLRLGRDAYAGIAKLRDENARLEDRLYQERQAFAEAHVELARLKKKYPKFDVHVLEAIWGDISRIEGGVVVEGYCDMEEIKNHPYEDNPASDYSKLRVWQSSVIRDIPVTVYIVPREVE